MIRDQKSKQPERLVVRSLFRLSMVLTALMLTLLIVSVAFAQTATPPPRKAVTPDDVNRIARQLYCPVCENEPVDVCRTSTCQQWRAQINQFLSQGQTDQEIIQYFIVNFGLKVAGAPPVSNDTIWLYLLPIVGALGGSIYVFFLMRRMRARGAMASAPPPAIEGSDDYIQRVERDLKKW